MRIGIDIGGTHTDGVLIDGTRLIAATKVPTFHDNLLASISRALHVLLAGHVPGKIRILNLSTTLSTNAIITGRIEPVGVFVTAGPGVAAEHYAIGDFFHRIPGSLDHLGIETEAVDTDALDRAAAACREGGVRVYAVVAKFSPRNPAHEQQIAASLSDCSEFTSQGSLLSGQLNFGRRIHTAYYNSAAWRTFHAFTTALKASLNEFNLRAEVNILKADGGTMPLAKALAHPVQSIFSGPAASVMGILATTPAATDLLMLDIGGTTTDIALFAAGAPLLEREGIAIEGRPTLVRAIRVESIGIGGDSQIRLEQREVQVGPQRQGPCMAVGGETPTLMDACNVLGISSFGDTARSRKGLETLVQGSGRSALEVAQAAVDGAVNAISSAISALVTAVNARPVYTIHELLEDREISPQKIVAIGGPALVFKDLLQHRLGLAVLVPACFGVANAIGAALTRSSATLTLTADTSRGRLSIPTLSQFRQIPRSFSLESAIDEARNLLSSELQSDGVVIAPDEIQITQADSFNMVEGSYTAGRNIRVVAQVQPAVIARLEPDAAIPVTTAA